MRNSSMPGSGLLVRDDLKMACFASTEPLY